MLMLLFTTVVLMHLAHKHKTLVYLYTLQSALLVALMIEATYAHASTIAVLAIVFTAVVKLVGAPYFFLRLIRQHKLTFSESAYLSTPVTLLLIALLTALTQSPLLRPLTQFPIPGAESMGIAATGTATPLLFALASIMVALFFIINRKGALSQMIGILAMENGIVAFATIAGLEQSGEFLLGIMFDLFAWVIIGTVFVAMIYRQFGALDVSRMKALTE